MTPLTDRYSELRPGSSKALTGIHHFSVLHCTELYRTVLLCTVVYCSLISCTVLYCPVLRCTELYCTLLYCTVLYCTLIFCTLQYCRDYTILYFFSVFCYTVLYFIVELSAEPYYTILYTVLYMVLCYIHLVYCIADILNVQNFSQTYFRWEKKFTPKRE